MTDKLMEHMRAMQAAVTAYLTHGGELAKDALINDLIYMLDGPEQRDAELAAMADANELTGLRQRETDLEDLVADLRAKVVEMRDRVAVSESDKMRAVNALGEERKIQNDLRTRLYNSELAYAKLHGYLEGRQDAEPPRMVPEQRESLMARMPDASGVSTGWRNDASHWFHRT